VNAEGSGTRPADDPWQFGLYVNYAKNSLVVVDGDGEITNTFVGDRVGADVLASFSVADPFSIGVGMPLYFQGGDAEPSAVGLGELRVVPKLRILNDRESVGLALAAEVRAPTDTGDFSGDESAVSVTPKLILDHRFRSGLRLGANVGATLREESRFFNVLEGNELVYAAAAAYAFNPDTELGVEFNGGAGLNETDTEEVALEALPYLRQGLAPDWVLQGGVGVGVMAGYGVPTFRAFLGVRWSPTSHDADRDGISDADDKCPNEAEDMDHFEDMDGCPEEDPDTDQDGVPDHQDDCPEAKETINGVDDDDGCPDTGDPRVIYEDGEFKILDAVQFEHGSAKVTEKSRSLLDQVALMIKSYPQVERVRIEGHTDDTGPEDVNQRLSEQRANSVRTYLINKGVSPKRLSAKGYGESKPLVDGTSESDRTQNRRVQFVVESED
jgi:outer membrane protein OmpA-like peptidoglycan-associated protein